MQNVAQRSPKNNPNVEKVTVNRHDIGNLPSTPNSSNSSPATDTYSERRRFMSDSSESEEDSVSEVESFVIDQEYEEEDPQVEAAKFLLSPDEDRSVDPETQARLEALLHAAGIGQLTTKDGKLADPEVLRRLTSSVSCALDEAAAALTRMRTDNPRVQPEKTSIVEATVDGDVGTVRKLLGEGRSVHETSEEGESLLSLACSAGYFELAQVLLAMQANVEDRGIKGECTPLMEAASAGHIDIVRLLVAHGADVNAQSSSGNTPLMYGCAGGHVEVVKFLLQSGAKVEDHNENGHTPLMEAASAGHVELARILLENGAGINTHSNEFKESALTLACYKGHLDMVRYLLEAGADQEHKTDEMHTALMEASMDGHVEVARLLLDSGAQVNMPTDSFESPLTLAACGGHVDLAMLLIERGANIEEVNDEGYTPLMEAAREGHEEMVALLLSQGANINAQTDETQETALTLACCGGFSDVADFLIKAGADIELGASTPLMEAAQEGHLELVRFILENNGNVSAQTQTGDTALTYACENGHTDVADLLLQYNADLEHESEGGRTPLMKACRAGHACVVQFLISKGANINKQTTNNDHTPLSLACAGGNLPIVELLLTHGADINHKLKDNSTMLIEAAKGGHTGIVTTLLDYPHSLIQSSVSHGQTSNRGSPLPTGSLPPTNITQPVNFFQQPSNISCVSQDVCEDVLSQEDTSQSMSAEAQLEQLPLAMQFPLIVDSFEFQNSSHKNSIPKNCPISSTLLEDSFHLPDLTHDAIRTMTLGESSQLSVCSQSGSVEDSNDEVSSNGSIIDFVERQNICIVPLTIGGDGNAQRKSISQDMQNKLERDIIGKQQSPVQPLLLQNSISQTSQQSPSNSSMLQNVINPGLPASQQSALGIASVSGSTLSINNNLQVHNAFYTGPTCLQPSGMPLKLSANTDSSTGIFPTNSTPPTYFFSPLTTSGVPLSTTTSSVISQPLKFPSGNTHVEINQNTSVNERPKAKPVSKKENKNLRKQPHQSSFYSSQQSQVYSTKVPSLQQQQLITSEKSLIVSENLNIQGLDADSLNHENVSMKDDNNMPSILQQLHPPSISSSSLRAFIGPTQKTHLDLYDQQILETHTSELGDVCLDSYNAVDVANQLVTNQFVTQHHVQAPQFSALDESMIASLSQHDIAAQNDNTRLEYFAPPNTGQLPVQVAQNMYAYDQYLHVVANMPSKDPTGAIYQAGFQAGMNIVQQQLASSSENFTTTIPNTIPTLAGTSQQFITTVQPPPCASSSCTHIATHTSVQPIHPCQIVPCNQQHIQSQSSNQVQAATQTPQTSPVNVDFKKQSKTLQEGGKAKKSRSTTKNQVQQPAGLQLNTNQNFQIDSNSAITQYSSNNQQCLNTVTTPINYGMDVDTETESNHDTALTLACAGGHDELVEVLLKRGADIEHRDKKGFTPLILAATAGHDKVVNILLLNHADIEAQSERTKDTPLSLACSGGRFEVVDILLGRGANKEHRNVSDYTPLSLAASGGYVNIIKLLLQHGAEINSRTGSKLGISPLMLAAMNGHTAAVKLLLDMGSDINAQIETNRNTALTLACFQGRHEVVSLLLDRKANVEHRAKTGLTPLMEAASGGYVEVGRVLLDKGADVNATPVPSSRDTALTIAADKGHCRFVELLLCRGAAVEVKNKKGNSPLWLAANGGHLGVVELLYNLSADIDSQDNRKVSCLVAAFRKGHIKTVKWMVNHVTQFPSDQDMVKYIGTLSDKDLHDKCNECMKIIRAAKDTQAAKANENASSLLEELDKEKTREQSKRASAARRRERKKKKKLEKREVLRRLNEENEKNEKYNENDKKCRDNEDIDKFDDEDNLQDSTSELPSSNEPVDKEEGDSGIDANSQGSCSSNDVKTTEKRKEKKKKKSTNTSSLHSNKSDKNYRDVRTSGSTSVLTPNKDHSSTDLKDVVERHTDTNFVAPKSTKSSGSVKKCLVYEATRHPAERDDFEATGVETYVPTRNKKSHLQYENEPTLLTTKTSPKQQGKREEGWKEVVRKSSVQTTTTSNDVVIKKVSVASNAISRVIGRAGNTINAIRNHTGAHIEVEKQSKGQGERIVTIKGVLEATKSAHNLITVLINNTDADISQLIPSTSKLTSTTTTLWDKTQLGTKKAGKALSSSTCNTTNSVTTTQSKTCSTLTTTSSARPISVLKPRAAIVTISNRGTAPRLAAQGERNSAAQLTSNTKNTLSYTTAVVTTSRSTSKIITATASQTFAAKLTETTSSSLVPVSTSHTQSHKTRAAQSSNAVQSNILPTIPTSIQQGHTQNSPKHHRLTSTASVPSNMQHFQAPGKHPPFSNSSSSTSSHLSNISSSTDDNIQIVSRQTHTPPTSSQPNLIPSISSHNELSSSISMNKGGTQEYSLFNSMLQQPTWKQENDSLKPINFAAITGGNTSHSPAATTFAESDRPMQVDASKAPGYRGTTMCSPVSSKTASSTPPNLPIVAVSSYSGYQEQHKNQQLPPIGTLLHNRNSVPSNPSDISHNLYFAGGDIGSSRSMAHLVHSETNLYKTGSTGFQEVSAANMLNMPVSDSQQHLLPYQTNPIQHLAYSQPQQQQASQIGSTSVSMSRLNPKAPDFSAHFMSNKQPMFNYPLASNPSNSNLHNLGKSMNSFHRAATSVAHPRLPTILPINSPFVGNQADLISGMAGMTLHNIARAAGGEILENTGDLGNVNGSPAMSPNLQVPHGLHPNEGHYIEDRKQPPQPIGTERTRKTQNPNMENWMSDSKGIVRGQWVGNANLDRFQHPVRSQLEPDYISHTMDSFQHGMPIENPHNYPGGAYPTYLLHQQQQHQPQHHPQQQLPGMRAHDFIPNEPQWEGPRSNMTELPDKPHGWTKWNQ